MAGRKHPCRGSARRGEMPTCYWAIAHSGNKIAVQPNTDNVKMHIIAARTESGRSVPFSAFSGATE